MKLSRDGLLSPPSTSATCGSGEKPTDATIHACRPTKIVKVLEFIGKKKGLQLPSGFAARIAEKSNRSLRRAILAFETCHVQQLFQVRGKIYELLINCIPPEIVLKRLLFELLKSSLKSPWKASPKLGRKKCLKTD
ncbi:hypothetical protein RHGRI_037129 [Rhododendron griersonianum]|uniref:Uncharacterized protein n=1 Tax=Rhododendron griersonianum TaxID=479676 RepID=A0AAV6HW16_9ERIC|nr:hypothetical protein RHGRI_037129 [Rhododendron griersonianum]